MSSLIILSLIVIFVVVEAICRTPIGNEFSADRCFWRFTENDTYSVKSGYMAAIGYYDPPPNSSNGSVFDWNKLIWPFRVPPKMKIFLWRAMKDMIPVGLPLRRHHVPASPLCNFCKKDWGTISHTFFLYEKVSAIWVDSDFWVCMKKYRGCSFVDIARTIHKDMRLENYEVWVNTIWLTWRHLCNLLHGNPKSIMPSIDSGIECREAFYKARQVFGSEMTIGVCLGDKRWVPPQHGVFRMDIDAAVDLERGGFGVGIVIRDWLGRIIAAMAKPILRPQSVLSAELLGVLNGVGFCIKEEISPIEIFSDSALLVRTLTHTTIETTVFDEELSDTLELLSQCLVFRIGHMFRSANFLAHSIASFAMSYNQALSWTSNFPT